MAAVTLAVSAVVIAAAGTTATIVQQEGQRKQAAKAQRRSEKQAKEAAKSAQATPVRLGEKTTAELSGSIGETERVNAAAAAARARTLQESQQRRSVGGFGASPGLGGRSPLG